MIKPRVTWTYYPKLGRGFWRVSPMPRGRTSDIYRLWTVAHAEVSRANHALNPYPHGRHGAARDAKQEA